jgi:hypothetical protein
MNILLIAGVQNRIKVVFFVNTFSVLMGIYKINKIK